MPPAVTPNAPGRPTRARRGGGARAGRGGTQRGEVADSGPQYGGPPPLPSIFLVPPQRETRRRGGSLGESLLGGSPVCPMEAGRAHTLCSERGPLPYTNASRAPPLYHALIGGARKGKPPLWGKKERTGEGGGARTPEPSRGAPGRAGFSGGPESGGVWVDEPPNSPIYRRTHERVNHK